MNVNIVLFDDFETLDALKKAAERAVQSMGYLWDQTGQGIFI